MIQMGTYTTSENIAKYDIHVHACIVFDREYACADSVVMYGSPRCTVFTPAPSKGVIDSLNKQ